MGPACIPPELNLLAVNVPRECSALRNGIATFAALLLGQM